MSQTVDERIVEMRFDNKQFEQNVKESMNTLEKLKASLNMDGAAKSFESLDKAANNVSLEGIAAGIEALQNRFSTLGIIGMTVVQNLTNSLMGLASSAVNYISSSIIGGGWKRAMNIENAHFQLQALLKDEMAVQAVMDDAMASVDGTAYAYDEAAKAASQFAASGLRAGEEMQNALRGITGVAAMTNSEYEGIARIFNTVAGNGRLMGDQLLQLSSRGMNAAATIADYLREVEGFSDITEAEVRSMVSESAISFDIFASAMNWAFGESAFRANETFTGSLANMGAALKKIGAEFFSPLIEQNSDFIGLINTLRTRINDVKKEVVFDAQASAISGISKASNMATEDVEFMFNTMKQYGTVASDELEVFAKNGVDALGSLTDYINGVVDGSVRSTYAITNSLNELTGGLKVNAVQVMEFVENGQIDLKTFTNAMERAYGDQMKYSREFSDSVLDMAKSVSTLLKSLDISKIMKISFKGIESVKNVVKGLYSVLKPVGEAFGEVFLIFTLDDIDKFAEKIEILTSKMKLNEKQSKNLHDAFSGVFSIVKLLIDGLLGLFGATTSVVKPVGSFAELVLELAGGIGRLLTSFSEWVRSSETLNKIYDGISSGIKGANAKLSEFVVTIGEFVKKLYELPIVQNAISNVTDKIKDLGVSGVEKLSSLVTTIGNFAKATLSMLPESVQKAFSAFIEKIIALKDAFVDMDVEAIGDMMEQLGQKVKGLSNALMSNKGISTFVENAKAYAKEVGAAFTFDHLTDNVNGFRGVLGSFVDWFKTTVIPVFSDVSLGGLVATAGGAGAIYGILKVSKSLESVSKSLTAIPNFFNALKGVLTQFQKEIKSEALLKIAEAITLLSISLTMLSFANMENLFKAAVVLGAVGVSFVLAAGYFEKGLASLTNGATNAYSVLGRLATAVGFKAIGDTIMEIGLSVGIIVTALLALVYTYAKHEDELNKAEGLLFRLVAVILGFTTILLLLSRVMPKSTKTFAAGAAGVLAISLSLGMIVSALGKLFKLDIPADWETKIHVLANVFVGLGALVLVMSLGAMVGGQQWQTALALTATILAFSVSLSSVVKSISKLMKISLPSDWEEKLKVLGLIFVGLGALVLVMGLGSAFGYWDSAIAIAGSVLALSAALYLAVSALNKLFKLNIPEDGQAKLVILAGIMTGLLVVTAVLSMLSGSSGGKVLGAAVTVLALSTTIAAIVVALGILQYIPGEKLLSGALALGGVLITLGIALAGAGKIANVATAKAIVSMAVMVGTIVVALGVLSMMSWGALLKGAVTLGSVLLVLALVFKAAGSISEGLTFASILAMAANIGVIAVALNVLSEHPWESILAAAAALGGVLFALVEAFKIISETDVDTKSIISFITGAVCVVLLGYALSMIADQPWSSILASGTAISEVLLSLTGAFLIMQGTRFSWDMAAEFLLGVLAIAAIGLVLNMTAKDVSWQSLLATGTAISEVLLIMSVVMGICTMVASTGPAAIGGLVILDAFIADLVAIVSVLGLLSEDARTLIETGGQVLMDLGTYIGQFIGNIVGGAIVSISNSLPILATNLSSFAGNIQPFINNIKDVDSEAVSATGRLLEIVVLLGAAEFVDGLIGLGTMIFGGSDLKQKLKDFGDAMVEFSSTVDGKINVGAVNASARAGEALAELYASLPKEEGWMQTIFGTTKSLSTFADELTTFGSAMVAYSDTVDGKINEEAVRASVNAAQILVTFNDKLGTVDGLYQAIFGHQKTLAEFAAELLPFGTSIVSYSKTVSKGINQAAIQASADAGEILVVFSDKLGPSAAPNLYSAIFGHQKTLSEFAAELIPFGQAMVNYSSIVKGKINSSVISASTKAAETLVNIQNALGDTGGLKSLWSGDNSMDKFGKNLESFADSLVEYSNKVSHINLANLIAVNEQIEKLGAILYGLSTMDTSGMSKFSNAFRQMGESGIDGFISAFTGSTEKVKQTVDDTVNTVNNQITTASPGMSKNAEGAGHAVGDALAIGISGRRSDIGSAVGETCSQIVTDFQLQLSEETFTPIGEGVSKAISDGITSKKPFATSAAEGLTNAVADSIKSNLTYNEAYNVGVDVGNGIINGLNSKISAATKKGFEIGAAMLTGAKKGADERSPSHEAYRIAQYVGVGLINGLDDIAPDVYNSGYNIGETAVNAIEPAINAISKLVDEGINELDPTITPIIDLSNAEDSIDDISSMFNNVALRKTMSLADGSASGFAYAKTLEVEDANLTKSLIDKIDDLVSDRQTESNIENIYNFNITSTDPKEAADEISYILQHQVERGRATWGK